MGDDIQVVDDNDDIRALLRVLVDDVARERWSSDRVVLPGFIPIVRPNGSNTLALDDATEEAIDAAINALLPDAIATAADQLDSVVKLFLAREYKREET